jgi:hypothetical protein
VFEGVYIFVLFNVFRCSTESACQRRQRYAALAGAVACVCLFPARTKVVHFGSLCPTVPLVLLWLAACVPLSIFLVIFFWGGVPSRTLNTGTPDAGLDRTQVIPMRQRGGEGNVDALTRSFRWDDGAIENTWPVAISFFFRLVFIGFPMVLIDRSTAFGRMIFGAACMTVACLLVAALGMCLRCYRNGGGDSSGLIREGERGTAGRRLTVEVLIYGAFLYQFVMAEWIATIIFPIHGTQWYNPVQRTFIVAVGLWLAAIVATWFRDSVEIFE